MNTENSWENGKNDVRPESIVMENGRVSVVYTNPNDATLPSLSSSRHRRAAPPLGSPMWPRKITRDSSRKLIGSSGHKATSSNHNKKPPPSTPSAHLKKPPLPPSAPTPRTRFESPLIDIAPGLELRLRGAKETMACIHDGFYIPIACHACQEQLCCILDANYVICPLCRCVSPVGLMKPQDTDEHGGVALGVTMNDLMSWQGGEFV